jgi:hypothetical protein
MADGFVQVFPDSTGKKVQTFENTISGQTVEAQATVLVGPDGNPIQPSNSTVSSVASSTSTVTILAANAARRGAIIFNDSTSNLYVKLGSGASTTSFSVRLGTAGLFQLPYPVYTGIITGVWSSVNGAARVTELT